MFIHFGRIHKEIRPCYWEIVQEKADSFSHGCRRASSLGEGASGEEEEFSVLPKPPSMREVASQSDDGRSCLAKEKSCCTQKYNSFRQTYRFDTAL